MKEENSLFKNFEENSLDLENVVRKNKPILFLGVGQEYKDIEFFDTNLLNKLFE